MPLSSYLTKTLTVGSGLWRRGVTALCHRT